MLLFFISTLYYLPIRSHLVEGLGEGRCIGPVSRGGKYVPDENEECEGRGREARKGEYVYK